MQEIESPVQRVNNETICLVAAFDEAFLFH
ncbi:MAG: Uncharacterised protein [Hyphomonas sp. TMED17]|nr:MAG: Uncharacterised protein [Hyphomonas sp. TMED17]